MHLKRLRHKEKHLRGNFLAHTKPKAPSHALAKPVPVERLRGKKEARLTSCWETKRRIVPFVKESHFHSWPFSKALRAEVAGAGKWSSCWLFDCSASPQNWTGCSIKPYVFQKSYTIHWSNTGHLGGLLATLKQNEQIQTPCQRMTQLSKSLPYLPVSDKQEERKDLHWQGRKRRNMVCWLPTLVHYDSFLALEQLLHLC